MKQKEKFSDRLKAKRDEAAERVSKIKSPHEEHTEKVCLVWDQKVKKIVEENLKLLCDYFQLDFNPQNILWDEERQPWMMWFRWRANGWEMRISEAAEHFDGCKVPKSLAVTESSVRKADHLVDANEFEIFFTYLPGIEVVQRIRSVALRIELERTHYEISHKVAFDRDKSVLLPMSDKALLEFADKMLRAEEDAEELIKSERRIIREYKKEKQEAYDNWLSEKIRVYCSAGEAQDWEYKVVELVTNDRDSMWRSEDGWEYVETKAKRRQNGAIPGGLITIRRPFKRISRRQAVEEGYDIHDDFLSSYDYKRR